MVSRAPLALSSGLAWRALVSLLSLGAAAYLAGLAVWLALWLIARDATWWLFVVNALVVYLFLPLPLVFLIAWLSRRRSLLIGGLLAMLVWLYFWGGLFLPRLNSDDPAGPSLTVMTFNTLVFNRDVNAVVDSIREADADVVFLLELNIQQSEAIEVELAGEYPFMTLDPGDATGDGVISRTPYRVLDAPELADSQWIGPPTVIEMEVDGRAVRLVRFHSLGLVRNFPVRERQSRKLAAYARNSGVPIILAGDLNATPMNDSYGILTDVLTDAWREAGFGLGHTFPGASRDTSPGSARPELSGIPVPKWLVRIDYVLHSSHWHTASVRAGPDDGRSDHRPVVARLVLKP